MATKEASLKKSESTNTGTHIGTLVKKSQNLFKLFLNITNVGTIFYI